MNATNLSGDLMDRLRLCLPPTRRGVSEHLPLGDFGLDSMDIVEFLCTVHAEFDVRLREEDIQPEQTLATICRAIAERKEQS